MILTYQYRLLPTRSQHARLAAILEDERRLYNAALQERIDAYQRSLIEVERGLRTKPLSIGFMDQTNSITVLNNDPLTRDDFGKIPALLHHWTLKRLDDAYKAFFRRVKARIGQPGFPRFRGREYWHSFGSTIQGGNSPVRIDDNRIRIGGRDPRTNKRRDVLRIRVDMHRPLPADAVLKAAIFTRATGGRKWHVCLQLNIPDSSLPKRCQSRTATVGIDVGISIPLMQSDGVAIPSPKYLRRSRHKRRRLQRAIARAKRGSNRRQKVKQRLAAHEAKTARVRTQWAHKQAARLTRCYALVSMEDLAVANMTRSAKGTIEAPGRNVRAKAGLNREILTIGWSDLREKLAYKAERDGSRLVLVDPRYTSQRCNGCGAIVPKTLAQRTHHCPECGLVLDRDHNAAKNIDDAGRLARGDGNGEVAHRRPGNTVKRRPDSDGEMPSHPSSAVEPHQRRPALAKQTQGDSDRNRDMLPLPSG